MTTLHLQATVEADGELRLTNLPLKRGQHINLIVRVSSDDYLPASTAKALVESDVVGLWADRDDIDDTLTFKSQHQHF